MNKDFRFSQYGMTIVAVLMVGVTITAFQNCAGDLPSEAQASSHQSQPNTGTNGLVMPQPQATTPVITPTISFSPSPAISTESISLSAAGGTAPYAFSLVSGSGTLAGNVLVASAISGSAVVRVTDANGNTGQVTVPFGPPAQLTLYKFPNAETGIPSYSTDPSGSAGVGFRVFISSMANSKPFIKCGYNGMDAPGLTSYAVGSVCPGMSFSLGAVGYVSSIQRPNTIPLYGVANYPSAISLNPGDLGILGVAPSVIGYVMP